MTLMEELHVRVLFMCVDRCTSGRMWICHFLTVHSPEGKLYKYEVYESISIHFIGTGQAGLLKVFQRK